MKTKHILQVICLSYTMALFLPSCQSHKHNEADTHGEESHTEEVSETVVALNEEQMQTVGIELGSVEYKELTYILKTNGVLRVPNNAKASVTPLLGGVVRSIDVSIGGYVDKGQTIAKIANQEIVSLQEEYLSIKTRLGLAQQELQRQSQLNEANAGAVKNLQSATAEYKSLNIRMKSLAQQLQMIGISPQLLSEDNIRSELPIVSPISGSVSDIMAKIGSFVDATSPVAEVVNNRLLHLDLQLFEKDLYQAKVGQKIHFTLTNNPVKEYDAQIFNIGSSFEDESKSISVHAKVVGNTDGLFDGMNVIGLISLNDKKIAAVPNDAIVSSEGKYYIFIKTDKEADEHHHDNVDEDHGDAHTEGDHDGTTSSDGEMFFERIEVSKGISEVGYTAITPIVALSQDSQVVVKGAFFINAKMTNSGSHGHAH
ncbi:MAG: efflux transporter periplasmic adaptor subunit [Bacteroidales bacterium]|nr:MAG: efflux transporter periplasmic adaptor subunit [Bacteroidales bacterium]